MISSSTTDMLWMKFLIFLIILPMSISARQPAVLPGYGLSIEKENKVLPKPDNFPGYEFKNLPQKTNVVQKNLDNLSKSGPQSISIYLTIFALLFPFGLWLLNNRSLKDENELINKSLDKEYPSENSNIVSIDTAKSISEEDTDEESEDQKKAS